MVFSRYVQIRAGNLHAAKNVVPERMSCWWGCWASGFSWRTSVAWCGTATSRRDRISRWGRCCRCFMEFLCVVEFCVVGFQSSPDQRIVGYHVVLRVLVSCRSRVVSRVRCRGGICWHILQLGVRAEDDLCDEALSFLE